MGSSKKHKEKEKDHKRKKKHRSRSRSRERKHKKEKRDERHDKRLKRERDEDEERYYEEGEIPGLDLVKREEPRTGTVGGPDVICVRVPCKICETGLSPFHYICLKFFTCDYTNKTCKLL